ncbi:heme-degrading domain-containing protein [Rhizobium binxianense]
MAEHQTIEELQAEAEELQFPAFNPAIAWEIGSYIQKRAAAENMPIAFEISKIGQQIFFFATPGAMPDNAHWIRRKRAVVERFYRSSLLMKLLSDREGRPLLDRYILSADDYVASGGSVPIVVAGSGCVGSVTVSGLTQYDDHRLAVEGIRHAIAGLKDAAGPTRTV